MNGSHNFLIEHGIIPDLFFMVDARPINLPFLSMANDHTTYIIASQCQPEIFEALADRKVLVWQMFHDEHGIRAIKESAGEREAPCFVGGHNVGHSCLTAVWALGYKSWQLIRLRWIDAWRGQACIRPITERWRGSAGILLADVRSWPGHRGCQQEFICNANHGTVSANTFQNR